MLAMQYNITLPADYDMEIIRQRIASKGHLMNNFPHLEFKAFLYACRDGGRVISRENLYAPFYLWRNPAGLNTFLCGKGFAALTEAFGRPKVTIWSVWHAELTSSFETATFATREIMSIAPQMELEQLQKLEIEQTMNDVREKGALAAIVAFEPTNWKMVRFRLWNSNRRDIDQPELQTYEVGYLALSPSPD